MTSFIHRYRWWLLIVACLTACMGANIGWWQSSAQPQSRFTRAQYDRIRLGMTPAQVALCMGGSCSWRNAEKYEFSPHWETVAQEGQVAGLVMGDGDGAEAWLDEFVVILVWYCDGKALQKEMRAVPP